MFSILQYSNVGHQFSTTYVQTFSYRNTESEWTVQDNPFDNHSTSNPSFTRVKKIKLY